MPFGGTPKSRGARIAGIATAVPEHCYSQEKVREHWQRLFPQLMDRPGRAGLFDRSGVRTRFLVEPDGYYRSGVSFEQRNRDFLKHALYLATECVQSSSRLSGVALPDIRHIISVTTTGLLTPSLEAHLAQALPFARDVKRTPVFGVGCAGGVVGLSRSFDYLLGRPDETVLLLSVELCSLSFLPSDESMTQLVAATLFGDGAVAVVLRGENAASAGKPMILDSASLLLPESLDVMGWDFSNNGMRLVLSKRAPQVVETHLRAAVESFLARSGLAISDVSRWLLHPGSSRILDACEKALGLGSQDTRWSRRFLERFGNLSSASILFILKDALQEPAEPGSYAVAAAMGPGFASELVLIRFP